MPHILTPSPELLLDRMRGEYREMPGLRLTVPQACRLWQLDRPTCEALLARLTGEHFLRRTPDGAYVAQPARRTAAVADSSRQRGRDARPLDRPGR